VAAAHELEALAAKEATGAADGLVKFGNGLVEVACLISEFCLKRTRAFKTGAL